MGRRRGLRVCTGSTQSYRECCRSGRDWRNEDLKLFEDSNTSVPKISQLLGKGCVHLSFTFCKLPMSGRDPARENRIEGNGFLAVLEHFAKACR